MKADLDLVKNIIDELIIILVFSCQLQAFEILITHCMIGSKYRTFTECFAPLSPVLKIEVFET